jgi:hypothetical protein
MESIAAGARFPFRSRIEELAGASRASLDARPRRRQRFRRHKIAKKFAST